MAALLDLRREVGAKRLRLETLTRLRWLAVAGQSAAVLGVHYGLGFRLPVLACLSVIALSASLNLVLRLRYPASLRLRSRQAALLLAYDILQLGALLYLTGGLQNPFAFLFLVPVMVSATALPPRHTIALGVLALVAASIIAVEHRPLPWALGAELNFPPLYVAGMWTALACTLAFMSIYTWRVAEEARQLAEALAASELVLAREQHLSALDGLAAAAAHELGTPLGTIALVAKELQRALPPGSPEGEDVALLMEQIGRCRAILGTLTSLSGQGDIIVGRMPLSQLIEEVVEPHRNFGVAIDVRLNGEKPEPIGLRNPGILYGLGNLVENAVDFARATVTLSAHWDREAVSVVIADDGPGFSAEIMDRIGEPYVTTRGRDARRSSGEHGGMGLGFFIAKTLLERTGASVALGNRPSPETGAVVTVVWPRRVMDAGVAGLALAGA